MWPNRELNGRNKIQIIPFVEEGECILIKDALRDYFEDLIATRARSHPDEEPLDLATLVMPLNDQDEDHRNMLRSCAEFFHLLLLYLSIPTRMVSRMTLLNIKPLFDMFPKRMFVVCRFTPSFPLDWRSSLERYK